MIETKLLFEDVIPPGVISLREIYEAANHGKAFAYDSRCVAVLKTLDNAL